MHMAISTGWGIYYKEIALKSCIFFWTLSPHEILGSYACHVRISYGYMV